MSAGSHGCSAEACARCRSNRVQTVDHHLLIVRWNKVPQRTSARHGDEIGAFEDGRLQCLLVADVGQFERHGIDVIERRHEPGR